MSLPRCASPALCAEDAPAAMKSATRAGKTVAMRVDIASPLSKESPLPKRLFWCAHPIRCPLLRVRCWLHIRSATQPHLDSCRRSYSARRRSLDLDCRGWTEKRVAADSDCG